MSESEAPNVSEPVASQPVVAQGILDRFGRLQGMFGGLRQISEVVDSLGDAIVIGEIGEAIVALRRFQAVKQDADLTNEDDRREVIDAALQLAAETADCTTTGLDDAAVETAKKLRANLPFVDSIIGSLIVSRLQSGVVAAAIRPDNTVFVFTADQQAVVEAQALDPATVSLIASLVLDLIERIRRRRQEQ